MRHSGQIRRGEGAQAGGATPPAKLRAPLANPFQIPRERICTAVLRAHFVRLVLLHAPAGFGKTTAMLQCRAQMQAAGVVTAWLTLDAADNDVERFLDSLQAVFADVLPDLAGAPAAGVAATAARALALIDRIAAAPVGQGVAIFLDDLEAIHNPAVAGLMWQLVEKLPPGMQVVAATRYVPESGLARLRARGELLEIEPTDLRFSAQETARFLGQARGLALSATAVQRLHQRTEGWAAALWLVSLALERRAEPDAFIAGFSGSNTAIAEYLLEDVFQQLPAPVRDFLLDTSILQALCGPLCEAVCRAAGVPAGQSADMLAWLERANLFLIPLDDTGETPEVGQVSWPAEPLRWYRYHSLFVEFLRSQLKGERAARLPLLHLAASQWYAQQARPAAAIEHALAAGAPERALPLLHEHVGELLAQGRMRLLASWLDRLPTGDLETWPRLYVARIWGVAFTRGPGEALALLQGIKPGRLSSEVQSHVRALRHLLLYMMDRFDEASQTTRHDPLPLPTGYPFPDAVLATSMARLAAVQGDYAEARRLIANARQLLQGPEADFNTIFIESVEGLIDLRQARLQQALARLRLAADMAVPSQYSPANGTLVAGILLAEVLYETDQIEQAQRLLEVHVPLARELGMPDPVVIGHVVLARIAHERGETQRAYEWVTMLEQLGHQRGLPRLVHSALLERSRLALLHGNRHAAEDALVRAADWRLREGLTPFANDVESLVLAGLRLELTRSPGPALIESIRRELDVAQAGGLLRRALKLRVLLAMAHDDAGQAALALEVMGQALHLCAAEGFVRMVVDEGRQARRLALRGLDASASGITASFAQRLRQACGEVQVPDSPVPAGLPTRTRSGLAEPLTPKEEQVLQLLAQGHSNIAMAEQLFVSESTVRTHMRNISAKLGASNRTQAVAIARQIGLL